MNFEIKDCVCEKIMKKKSVIKVNVCVREGASLWKDVENYVIPTRAEVRILGPLDKPGRGAPSYYYTEREKNCPRISDG